MTRLRRYHAAVWDEPVVLELGTPGARGIEIPPVEAELAAEVGEPGDLLPASMRRQTPPALPELSEPEVLRHYLHLSQETLGMMGISLFGTCTMKYNPRVNEAVASEHCVAELHPHQDEETLQGVLEIVHRFDQALCELSGMDRFVFQPGGGADAAYLHACVTRAYHAARGELEQRNEVITTIQAHPCNAATAAAAGFNVVTLPVEENGYPSLEALKAAVSDRTASLMINNPDDMGIYNPEIAAWVDIGPRGRRALLLRPRELQRRHGQDPCGASSASTRACSCCTRRSARRRAAAGRRSARTAAPSELVPFLPGPLVSFDGDALPARPRAARTASAACASSSGNVPEVVKAYAWTLRDGRRRHRSTRPTCPCSRTTTWRRSCCRFAASRSHTPHLGARRLEMTRYSLDRLTRGHGRDRRRRAEPDGRLRRGRVLAQPRAVARAGAVHAGSGRAVVEGRSRLLDRRARAHLRGGLHRPARSSRRRRTTRASTSSTRPASTTRTGGPRPGARTGGSIRIESRRARLARP